MGGSLPEPSSRRATTHQASWLQWPVRWQPASDKLYTASQHTKQVQYAILNSLALLLCLCGLLSLYAAAASGMGRGREQQLTQQRLMHMHPSASCSLHAPERRVITGDRPLILKPAPLANTAEIISHAAAQNDTVLMRLAQLLEQHRTTTNRSVAYARMAYAQALHAAGYASIPSFSSGGSSSSAAGSMIYNVMHGPPTKHLQQQQQQQQKQQQRQQQDQQQDALHGSQGSLLAVAMISEALSAIQDVALAVAKEQEGEPIIVPCAATADPSLPPTLPAGATIMIAANLHNSEWVMPNFLVQVLQLAVVQASNGGGDLEGSGSLSRNSSSSSGGGDGSSGTAEGNGDGGNSSIFVMIYESGSDENDQTGRWLTMLRMLLEPIGVPCNITSNGPLTRRDKQERIEFLAATRNALLPPIGSGGGNERTGGSRGGAASTPGGAEARAQGRDDNNVADRSLQGPFAASDVLFVNDVLFCAGDALRLLWLDADFACGLDFGPADNNRDPGHESRRRARRLMQEQKLPQGSGGDGGEKLQQRQLRQGGGNAHRQLQQQQQRPPQQPGNGSEGGGDEQQQQLLQQQQQFVQRQQQLLQEQQQKITQHSSQDFGEPGSTDSSSPAASGTSAPAGNAGSNNSKDGPKGQGMRRLAGYAPIIIKQSNPVVKLNFSMVLKKAAAQKRSPNSTEAFVRMPMYDVWVMRDMSGQRFRWSPPYGNTPALTQALERGLPFPVYCGWGGLVKVAAQPFAEGLRFRTHLDGECTASECSLLCDDLHRLGYRRMLMDPSARTSYNIPTAWVLHSGQLDLKLIGRVGTAPWSAVLRNKLPTLNSHNAGSRGGSSIDWDSPVNVPAYSEIDCCNKGQLHTEDHVDFTRCRPTDILARNYTRLFYHQCQIGGAWGPTPAAAVPGGGSSGGSSGAVGLLEWGRGVSQVKRQAGQQYLTGRSRYPDGVWYAPQYTACPP